MRVELSQIECESILRKATKHEDVKIIDFKLENFGSYFGFLGEYFRLEIDANVNDVPEVFHFFVKSLPTIDLKQRKMLMETGIFRKEVKLYENLLSEFSTGEKFWCPKGYLFRDDLLVLDNMALKGYKMLPFQFKFEKQHVEVTLKSLASFHCSSIVYEEMNGKNSIPDKFEKILFETSVADIPWYHAGLKAIFDIALQKTKYGKTHGDLIKESFYAKLFESIENMESTQEDVLKVLTHRDVWKNNMMFKFGDDKSFKDPLHCVLLDFQTARYLSISIDVLMTIICTTTRSHQEKHFNYYLKFYYDHLLLELKKCGINLSAKMTFESFNKSCQHHKRFTLIYNVIIIMITMIRQEFFVNFGEDEYRDFAEGNRSKSIFDNMKQDSFYEECLVEAVEAVIEFVYKMP